MMDGRQRYICVHCLLEKNIPGGCLCVSPFADNAVLADMRRQDELDEYMNRLGASVLVVGEAMMLLGDACRDSVFTQPSHRLDWERRRKEGFFNTPGKNRQDGYSIFSEPPEYQSGGLMSSFDVSKICVPLGMMGTHAVQAECERDMEMRRESIFEQDYKMRFGHFEKFDIVPTLSAEMLNALGLDSSVVLKKLRTVAGYADLLLSELPSDYHDAGSEMEIERLVCDVCAFSGKSFDDVAEKFRCISLYVSAEALKKMVKHLMGGCGQYDDFFGDIISDESDGE